MSAKLVIMNTLNDYDDDLKVQPLTDESVDPIDPMDEPVRPIDEPIDSTKVGVYERPEKRGLSPVLMILLLVLVLVVAYVLWQAVF